MKECVKCLMAALVAIIGVTANADWTFNPEEGTVTDGIWTLHATLAKNSTDELEVNGSKGSFKGTEPSPINLTEIYDAGGKRYKAVAFETFSHHTPESSTLSVHKDKLTEFIAPDCRKLSGSGCFKTCSVLTNVYLNSSVTNFAGHRPFAGCSSLKLFHPRVLNITSIPIESFEGCAELAGEFSFPECTGNNGGGEWFSGCTKIESVKMPLMTEISGSSFNNCSNLKYVEFSKDLKHISTSAFSGCISLGGDFIRAMLNPEITQLGSNNPNSIFNDCSSFDGALEWNFPNLASTNIVGKSYFGGCTSLQKVVFKTYVYEIREKAFFNLAPGAEIFMHPEPVKIFESLSVGNANGPFIKVYIDEESEDEWVDVIDKTYHVMRKGNFNNRSWSEKTSDGKSTRSRDDMVNRMIEDQLMCAKDANTGDVTINHRNVIAFCMQDKSGGKFSGYPCFWLIKKSKTGLKVIVR